MYLRAATWPLSGSTRLFRLYIQFQEYAKEHKELSERRQKELSEEPAELYRRILDEFPRGTYLFLSVLQGPAFHREYISREIARAARRVLGRSVSAYVLRHSRATDLLASTHRIKAVSRLLGHSVEATTLR